MVDNTPLLELSTLLMRSNVFFVYLNIDVFPAAWAAYRGLLCSASTVGTDTFRPVAYRPYRLLKLAASGCKASLLQLEKEIALEQIRHAYYSRQVSRLHGIYVWGSEEDAIRCEPKWRSTQGQHFDRDRLVQVRFTYRNVSRVDTQWIDQFILDNAKPLDRTSLDWAHRYWRGEPLDETPHWEILVEGRGVISGTELRTKALQRLASGWSHLTGQVELARLAAEKGSDLYNIAPFVFRSGEHSIRVDFCIDGRDENDQFMGELRRYITTIEKNLVNWKALELLRSSDQRRPDLRQEGFEFDLNLLSKEARAGFYFIVSSRDSVRWTGLSPIVT